MGYARMINTPLDREQLTEFETVQRYHGINTIADVVRFLIRKEYRTIAQQTNNDGNSNDHIPD